MACLVKYKSLDVRGVLSPWDSFLWANESNIDIDFEIIDCRLDVAADIQDDGVALPLVKLPQEKLEFEEVYE